MNIIQKSILSLCCITVISSNVSSKEWSNADADNGKSNFQLALSYPDMDNIVLHKHNSFSFKPDNKITGVKEYKSKGKALLFSLLMPGAGEYYLCHKNYAKTFFITEVVLWSGMISFRMYSDWKRDDMKIYAAQHADARVQGKPSQYFIDIENYTDIHEYNDAKQRMGEFSKVYDVDEFFWSWDSESNRRSYEKMRISSDRAHNRAVFTIGAIIANHLISTIDAVWKTYRYNKKISKKANVGGVQLYFSSRRETDFSLGVQTTF